MIFEMVLSKNTFCWKSSLATYIFPAQQKSIMLCNWRLLHLHAWSMPRDVDAPCTYTLVGAARRRPNVLSRPIVSPEIEPRFPRHGAGNRGSASSKTPPPEIGAQFGPRVGGTEPGTFRLQACGPPTRPCIFICYIAIASCPSPATPNPNSKIEKSKRAVWSSDFGFWSLDFGFWILDFGFWSLDFGSWILDFGVWILEFGLS